MLEIGNKVKVFYGRDFFFGKIIRVNKKTVVVNIPEIYQDVTCGFDDVTLLNDVYVNKRNYRKFCRFEIGISDLVGEDGYPQCIVTTDEPELTLSDIICVLNRIIETDMEESTFFLEWFWYFEEKMMFSYSNDVLSQKYYIDYIFEEFRNWCDCSDKPDFVKLRDDAQNYISNALKPVSERVYPEMVEKDFLIKHMNEGTENMLNDSEVALYKTIAEKLCRRGVKEGIEAVAYGCYGGCRAFQCDWERSKDCLHKLFDTVDDAHDRATAANALGYIYYYGRCNGGEPQYSDAYKYFSYAAFFGMYEAKYKIADMYKNGYGVVKSKELSDVMIMQLYNENQEYIIEGKFDSKFADIALRMGDTFRDEDDYRNSKWELMLYFYLQADYAIRMRMLESEYYGDKTVFDKICRSLNETKRFLDYKPMSKVTYRSLEGIFNDYLKNGRRLIIKVKRLKDNRIKLKISAREGKLFLTIPILGMCGLYESLEVTAISSYFTETVCVDCEITVDKINGSRFMNDYDTVLDLHGYEYEIKSVAGKEKEYKAVSALYDVNDEPYIYLCEDEVKVGDFVVLKGKCGEKRLEALTVSTRKESELPLPLSCYDMVTLL